MRAPGIANYEISTKHLECPFNPELITNVICYFKRLNYSAEAAELHIYIKPGIKLKSFFVSWKMEHNNQ